MIDPEIIDYQIIQDKANNISILNCSEIRKAADRMLNQITKLKLKIKELEKQIDISSNQYTITKTTKIEITSE